MRAECLRLDDEIVASVARDKPLVVAVDAPLSPEPRWREVDREARRRGFKVIPPTLGPMAELTRRAWRLRSRLEELGSTVIETHPSSVLTSTSSKSLEELLEKLGLSCGFCRELPRDLEDAVLAAVAAYCYHRVSCSYAVAASDGVIYLARV